MCRSGVAAGDGVRPPGRPLPRGRGGRERAPATPHPADWGSPAATPPPVAMGAATRGEGGGGGAPPPAAGPAHVTAGRTYPGGGAGPGRRGLRVQVLPGPQAQQPLRALGPAHSQPAHASEAVASLGPAHAHTPLSRATRLRQLPLLRRHSAPFQVYLVRLRGLLRTRAEAGSRLVRSLLDPASAIFCRAVGGGRELSLPGECC